MPCAAEAGESGLELLDRGTEDELAAVEHPRDRCVEGLPDAGDLAREVQKRNGQSTPQ